jgi:hypothetical protein
MDVLQPYCNRASTYASKLVMSRSAVRVRSSALSNRLIYGDFFVSFLFLVSCRGGSDTTQNDNRTERRARGIGSVGDHRGALSWRGINVE